MADDERQPLAKPPERWRWPLPIAAVALLVAFVALRVSFKAYKIPSGAMIPSLEIGDHVFANRLAYSSHPPRRGDLIVFAAPEAEPSTVYIKRVVGLPGDTVEFDDGHPSINGALLRRCRVGTLSLAESADFSSKATVWVEFQGARAYWTSYLEGMGRGHQGPYLVPEGQVFVVGDNRHASHDSRAWNGGEGAGIAFEAVEGRVGMIWLPLSRHQVLGNAPVESTRLDAEQRKALSACLARGPN